MNAPALPSVARWTAAAAAALVAVLQLSAVAALAEPQRSQLLAKRAADPLAARPATLMLAVATPAAAPATTPR